MMQHKLDSFIQNALVDQPVSGTSLIISLFGDALSHRGGEIWLGSLSQLLAGLGFSDRFVRTALFRLTKEGWLEVVKVGRRSYYRLTERGNRYFSRAESRIYLAELPAWQGNWHLLLLERADKNERLRLRKELTWQGFGHISPNLMAIPDLLPLDIPVLLQDLRCPPQVIYFHANTLHTDTPEQLQLLIEECWQTSQLAESYDHFIALFRPLSALLMKCEDSQLTPEHAFYLRLLLIHAFRKVVLKDPFLPACLLPLHWQGQIARALCIHLYQRLDAKASAFVTQHAETTIGILPSPNRRYFSRFGGLPPHTALISL